MPIRSANTSNHEVGKVIANYDVDNRESGLGRGTDDQFVPDSDRIDEVNRQRQWDERKQAFGRYALYTVGTLAVAAAAVLAIKAVQSLLEPQEESAS